MRSPAAVQTKGLKAMCAALSSSISLRYRLSFRLNAAVAASPIAAAFGEAMHTSKAAPRPGTAAYVKMSAGLEVRVVSPRGSVVTDGSANLKPLTTSRTQP